MSNNLIKRKTLILVISILVLGFVLRAHNYSTWPRFGATMDEYAWTWLGINLIQNQIPSSWSSHPQYENYKKHLVYQGASFWIVKPYLEHPPFFGLVAGSFALANGAHDMYDIDIGKIRPLALILGTLSIGILFLLIKEIYGEKTALLSSLLYSIIPTVAIGSRIVQNENFFIPSFLAALYFTVRYLKTKKRIFVFLAAIICGILIISKIPWVAAGIGVTAILVYSKKYKEASIIFTTSVIFFLGFLAYGYFYNWDLFISLWKLQLQRYDLTFNSVYALFREPYLADRFMIDGWIYFGWISFFLLLVKDFKKNYVVILGLLAYLGVFIFAIPNEPGHGWYRYPFYPFLAVYLAIFIRDYFNKNIILTFLFVLFMGLSLLELTWTKALGFSFLAFRSFLVLSSLSLLPLFFKNIKLKKYSYALNYIMLVGIFSLSFFAVLLYNEQ